MRRASAEGQGRRTDGPTWSLPATEAQQGCLASPSWGAAGSWELLDVLGLYLSLVAAVASDHKQWTWNNRTLFWDPKPPPLG